MTYLIQLIVMFLLGVILSAVFFVTRRNEVENKNPITQLTDKYNELQKAVELNGAKVSVLEKKLSPEMENQKLKEEMFKLQEDFHKTQVYLTETRNEISRLVMRLLASYKPIRRGKELDQ